MSKATLNDSSIDLLTTTPCQLTRLYGPKKSTHQHNDEVKFQMNVPDETEDNVIPQPLGLVPLYPFPPLTNKNKAVMKKPLLPMESYGASFLPPIYQQYLSFDVLQQNVNDASEQLVNEVVAEEVLDIYQQLFSEGGDFLDEAIEREIQEREEQQQRVAKLLAREVVEEVLKVACRETVLDVFDDIIKDHSGEVKARLVTDDVLQKYEDELLREIACEVLEMCTCGEICMMMVQEVLSEEAPLIVEEVLMQYGAQLAFSQYKQVTKFAAEHTLDGICEQILLPHDDSETIPLDSVIDHIALDVLLNKTLELDQCYKKEKCIPLVWYRKKLVKSVALKVALDELTEALDEQFL